MVSEIPWPCTKLASEEISPSLSLTKAHNLYSSAIRREMREEFLELYGKWIESYPTNLKITLRKIHSSSSSDKPLQNSA